MYLLLSSGIVQHSLKTDICGEKATVQKKRDASANCCTFRISVEFCPCVHYAELRCVSVDPHKENDNEDTKTKDVSIFKCTYGVWQVNAT